MRQTFCRDLRFPLGFCRNVRYNEDTNDFEGGEPHDKRRGLKRLFPQDHPAGGVGRAAVLHLPLRLRKERGTGLSLALDPLRAAVWDLAAAALDYTGRRLSGRRDCPVRAELHSGWNHRRFRPGLAVDCGGVVCAADGVEVDSWMTTLKTQTGGIIPSGFLIIPCPQKNHMHFLC